MASCRPFFRQTKQRPQTGASRSRRTRLWNFDWVWAYRSPLATFWSPRLLKHPIGFSRQEQEDFGGLIVDCPTCKLAGSPELAVSPFWLLAHNTNYIRLTAHWHSFCTSERLCFPTVAYRPRPVVSILTFKWPLNISPLKRYYYQ